MLDGTERSTQRNSLRDRVPNNDITVMCLSYGVMEWWGRGGRTENGWCLERGRKRERGGQREKTDEWGEEGRRRWLTLQIIHCFHQDLTFSDLWGLDVYKYNTLVLHYYFNFTTSQSKIMDFKTTFIWQLQLTDTLHVNILHIKHHKSPIFTRLLISKRSFWLFSC